MLILSKCQDIRIEDNIFESGSGNTLFVRSEMRPKWTKNISFRGNNYRVPNQAEDAVFQLAGEEYVGFPAWQKAFGEHDHIRRSTSRGRWRIWRKGKREERTS